MLFDKSRYVGTPTFKNPDGAIIFSTRKKRVYNKDNCTLYKFSSNDRIDTVSYKFYGHSKYWWHIMDCNDKYMCELDIKVGDYILIPSPSEVLNG